MDGTITSKSTTFLWGGFEGVKSTAAAEISTSQELPTEQLPKPIWSEWSAWSECSTACGGGRQIRWRQCGRREPGWRLPSQNQVSIKSIPTVKSASADSDKVMCLGNAYEERPCNENQCPADDISSSSRPNAADQPWIDNKEADGMWSAWTDCSRPCGGGVRYRWRPKQSHANAALIIPSDEPYAANADRQEEVCNTQPCSGKTRCICPLAPLC
ncbi:hypothetical protein P879_10951 [Paragonimus westermani]|uniref:Spondin domain-containing protein n=1 Tax=Paragonimus westermani TaxID=34504 RepID=A0A8T0DG61_9TREM|nr:hypothetical protein P879_10951 [Paragonimus westermani]